MDSNIAVRFYRVQRRSDDQPHFGDCLENLIGKEEDELVAQIDDVTIGVLDLTKDGSFITGDLTRHQHENLPTVLEKKKKPKKLELPTGAALGHHTAFRYDTRIGILGYQMTKNSVSMSRFNAYVAKSAGCETFFFLPILEPAQLKALNNMKSKTFLIKVADPHDLEAVENEQRELREALIGLKEFADGAYVKVQVGLGNTKGELDKTIIKSTVGWLLEQWAKKRGKIGAIKLQGKTNIDDDTALDFLKAHLGATETIDFSGLTPEENYKARHDLLRKIMTRHSATLKSMAKAA